MGPLHESWRQVAATSNYPFEDGSNLTTRDGLVLPKRVVLDAVVHPASPGPFRIEAIDVSVSDVQIRIRDRDQNLVATGSFPITDSPDEIPLLTPEGHPAGLLVTDPVGLAALRGWPRGLHTFGITNAVFVASACVPGAASGLLGVRVGERILTGEITFVGENGVVLRPEVIEGETVIRYDVVGDPLFYRARCEPAIQETSEESPSGLEAKRYVQSIRLVTNRGTPDERVVLLAPDSPWTGGPGKLFLTPAYVDGAGPTTALRITSVSGGLRFSLGGATN